jgi:hypothetical protein
MHQPTLQVGIGDRILKELAQLQLTQDQPLVAQQGHSFADRSDFVPGDVYSHGVLFGQYQEPDETKALRLCLGSATQIDPHDFIRRAAKTDALSQVLQPGIPSIEGFRV